VECQQFYIKALVEALNPFGDVLVVGFNQGVAVQSMQSYPLKTFTIIESDPKLAEDARCFASKYSNVSVFEGSWQEVLPKLTAFDVIFFNQHDSSLSSFCHKQSSLIVKQGEDLLKKIYETFPQLNTLCYSNKDIEELYHNVGHHHPKEFSRFLSELKERSQITEAQYLTLLKQYALPQSIQVKKVFQDLALLFLEKCLEGHLRSGGRFSCVSLFPVSKYEDPHFFDKVITNPDFDYQESFISVQPSENYHFNEALIMTLHKVC
jgi:hypothetical protein